MAAPDRRWNLNIHYHRAILGVAPPPGSHALDVGCGEGLLTFDLAARGLQVIGIDPHEPSIERATADPAADERSEFVCADFFAHEFEPQTFDLVASSAMLHHVDAAQALRRMRQLVRPSGFIAIVGFAQPADLHDRAFSAAGALVKRAHQIRGDYWEHHAPICWPPPLNSDQMASLGSRELPGSTFRRLMSNRYSLIWRAPS